MCPPSPQPAGSEQCARLLRLPVRARRHACSLASACRIQRSPESNMPVPAEQVPKAATFTHSCSPTSPRSHGTLEVRGKGQSSAPQDWMGRLTKPAYCSRGQGVDLPFIHKILKFQTENSTGQFWRRLQIHVKT